MKGNKFCAMFRAGGLTIPQRLVKRQAFCAGAKIDVPPRLMLDGYLTNVENQGDKPWCAAYSASTFAEGVLWRKNGYKVEIDPAPVYSWAKAHDGDPSGDGTTLDKALEALVALGYFADTCKVKTFGGAWFGLDTESALFNLKSALHRHGSCIIGMNIDSSWYAPEKGVIRGGGQVQGGHAVTLVGYDEDGVVIRNSWGEGWGHDGDGYLPNAVFKRQFLYGAVLTRCMDGV